MTKQIIQIIVDQQRCASSGNCAEIAPMVFTQDERTGVVVLLQDQPDEGLQDAAERAALLCPAQAISIVKKSIG